MRELGRAGDVGEQHAHQLALALARLDVDEPGTAVGAEPRAFGVPMPADRTVHGHLPPLGPTVPWREARTRRPRRDRARPRPMSRATESRSTPGPLMERRTQFARP